MIHATRTFPAAWRASQSQSLRVDGQGRWRVSGSEIETHYNRSSVKCYEEVRRYVQVAPLTARRGAGLSAPRAPFHLF